MGDSRALLAVQKLLADQAVQQLLTDQAVQQLLADQADLRR